jgi:putative oxidoreductase
MPITAVRVVIGIFFCISGGTKLFVPSQFSMMEHTLAESHVPFPHASAFFVSLVEFASGAGVFVGLLAPLCALVLVIDMIVAVVTNRVQSIQASTLLAWMDDFLYLPEVLYMMILVWLIFSGPGRYSLDGLIVRWWRREMNNQELFQTVQNLVDAWCERRALQALRCILRDYPLVSPLTDGWGELMTALKDVRAFAREQITPEELKSVNECIRAIDGALHRY